MPFVVIFDKERCKYVRFEFTFGRNSKGDFHQFLWETQKRSKILGLCLCIPSNFNILENSEQMVAFKSCFVAHQIESKG
jgi:hypothetical protein